MCEGEAEEDRRGKEASRGKVSLPVIFIAFYPSTIGLRTDLPSCQTETDSK
jgi:hypothetical protein